ncbi:MAG: M81 family metallopeptidase [Candidatus Rokubacteria bacterium]|nr:M81 family metallopeptidase [Candidatus Rokubacteria bacterium]
MFAGGSPRAPPRCWRRSTQRSSGPPGPSGRPPSGWSGSGSEPGPGRAGRGLLAGEAAVAEFAGTNTQLGGFLRVAPAIGAGIRAPVAASAHPSGYVATAAYEEMCDGDGVTSSDLHLFTYTNRPKPMYPFEPARP